MDYFRLPFNEMLERLKEAGEIDMIPLNQVIYALDIPGVDRHKMQIGWLSNLIISIVWR